MHHDDPGFYCIATPFSFVHTRCTAISKQRTLLPLLLLTRSEAWVRVLHSSPLFLRLTQHQNTARQMVMQLQLQHRHRLYIGIECNN
ncbi:hypothetical protein M407DRAFT_197418 [Tulasnella calospora MUT 4182]|uniref:Uncharacterized protein n=1 Tax=Tulasnella calospora MUT 4182 TaxID=1051891 RepID=A0A0C3QIP1_9AGAM|nr:hypothetical protein M407DRAFT_197418 [Tulasnella calospora MUT 4182]